VDLRRLRSGELLAGFCAAGLLLVMFLAWFGDQTAWESMPIVRVALVALVLCALTLVVLTVTSRTVALACSCATITIAVGTIALWLVLYRVAINEPGTNAAVSIEPGAHLGLLLVAGVIAGAWRTLADERTQSGASLRQTERVLAVRGAPRPPPPPRDPSRPARGS
jgi:hypothetical protein